MSKTTQVTVRMPISLKSQIEEEASNNSRSLNSEIITILEDSLIKKDTLSNVDSSIKVFHFDDLAQPAVTVEIPESVIGLMQDRYKDLKVEQNIVTKGWILKYYALRCIITATDAEQLIKLGATLDK